VISVSGSKAPVHVIPDRGYVLARFNPTTNQYEVVLKNTIIPGTGTYALIARDDVPHKLARSPGSRERRCVRRMTPS
jgi:hypothetical protein